MNLMMNLSNLKLIYIGRTLPCHFCKSRRLRSCQLNPIRAVLYSCFKMFLSQQSGKPGKCVPVFLHFNIFWNWFFPRDTPTSKDHHYNYISIIAHPLPGQNQWLASNVKRKSPWKNLQQKLKLFKPERGHTKMQPKQQALGEGFTARVVHEDLPVDLSLWWTDNAWFQWIRYTQPRTRRVWVRMSRKVDPHKIESTSLLLTAG